MSAHTVAPTHPFRDTFDRTPAAMARDPEPFPSPSPSAPHEAWFDDWRVRLMANLSRRSDGRWDPLTRTHG